MSNETGIKPLLYKKLIAIGIAEVYNHVIMKSTFLLTSDKQALL